MIDQKSEEVIETTATVVSAVFNSTLGSSFIATFAFAFALQFLWGMINGLQLIVLTVLFDL